MGTQVPRPPAGRIAPPAQPTIPAPVDGENRTGEAGGALKNTAPVVVIERPPA